MDNRTPLVLIVEDSTVSSHMLQGILNKNGYETHICDSAESARNYLSTNTPDLILLDVVMPGMDGYEFSRSLQEDQRLKDTPVIFLSAMNNEESILEGFRSGGVDYITKPFKTLELLARTKTHIELKKAKEKLLRMATTDELTGLANRRHFMDILGSEFERARRYQKSFSLIMIDIDHFKKINDSWGHKAGDQALQQTAQMLKSSLRTSDLVGRVGGEEFAVLLPETDIQSAMMTAEKLRQAVEAMKIPFGGEVIPVTISGGAASYLSSDDGIDEIYVRADSAMYQAKKDGRNRVHQY